MNYIENLKHCTACPRRCGINRVDGKVGFCTATDKIKVAKYMLHFWEEPCISGKSGSGTVFFSGCPLRCEFCQNHEISEKCVGREASCDELATIFLELQNMGANNINLVSPTIYVYQIIEAVKIAKAKGLKLPIIYNTSGYENVETIKLLSGIIDVYLPDFKYASDILARKYSKVSNYVDNVENVLKEMVYQVGNVEFNENGLIKKGVIIRHLILPNNVLNSKLVLKWIRDNLGSDVYVSIMAQYFPTHKAPYDKTLNRKITKEELDSVLEYAESIGLKNGYVQELGSHEEEYVPKFNC